jgi:translation initiation factor 4G
VNLSPMSPRGMPLPQQPGTPASHGGPLPPGGPPSPNASHVSAFATSSTPSTSSAGLPRSKSSASAFVPGGTPRKGLVIRDESGRSIDLSSITKQPPNGAPPVSPTTAAPARNSNRVFATWAARAEQSTKIEEEEESPALVHRKVKSLLSKLTLQNFEDTSDQIITHANKSETQSDGRTLIQIIRLVFEKATDDAAWSKMYARLCRKMVDQISAKVQDESIKDTEGKPIAGGQLIRKYLVSRCQEDFERGWASKKAAAAAAAKAKDDEAVTAGNADKKIGDGETKLYSEEYYASEKAKRQGLGLVKFIGELFKVQMLTERIMHECVKKLLNNVDDPEEEELESLCTLLTTVGKLLDTARGGPYMDMYFTRMRELTKNPKVNSRMQYMLLVRLFLR